MAAKNPLTDPAVPDSTVDGISVTNPDANAYKGFNFDMGTVNQNITCNSCHAGGGPAQFGRENEPLDELLEKKLGTDLFEQLSEMEWFVDNETILSKVGIDGDFLGYSDYDVGAGYIGKPRVFNFKRSGVNDTDCFMCHADASSPKKIKTVINNVTVEPIMPANPRVMVFKGMTADNETIVISLGVPPKIGDEIGEGENKKTVAKVDSAYYNSVPVEVLAAVYGIPQDQVKSFIENIKNGTDNRFFLYPNNANGATREVTRVVYFEHPKSTTTFDNGTIKDGGEAYVNGGAVTFKDDDNQTVYRTFAGYFLKYISTASLMGVDTDQDGVPLAYVRFVKENGIWKPEVYYDRDEFASDGSVNLPILMNRDGKGDANSSPLEAKQTDYFYSVPDIEKLGNNPEKPDMLNIFENKNREWGYVCSYCHMAIPYESGTINGEKVYTWVTRKGTLGLAAEIVKRGDVFSYDLHIGDKNNLPADYFVSTYGDFKDYIDPNTGQITDEEKQKLQQALLDMEKAKSVVSFDNVPIGYDVHFDSEKGSMTCLSCHGEGSLSTEEKELHPVHHDFLKGNDWGGHWDQSLDYNPSLKTCLDCHFGGSRELAAEVHTSAFGPEGSASIHMEKISCEVCHIPYKTHWTFRAFYDVLGYSYNFDNRMLGYDFGNNTTIPLPVDMFTPGFGPFMPIAGYGAPLPFSIARTENGKDIVVPIYKVDFDPRQAALRLGQQAFGIWEVPEDSFPWAWAPVIINNGFRPDEAGGQKFMYRIADPLTLVTWCDKSTGKVLYTREMAAALDGAEYSPSANKNVPAYFIQNGKVCVKTIKGDFICDDNEDYLPEIDTDIEYQAMKAALTDVLTKEGVHNPDPVFYIWTAPFSIDHGVLPKDYALGAGKEINGEKLSCDSCHDAKKGRLPQANMNDINGDITLSSLIEKDENGNIKFFGLGREIVTVPVKIPASAYREAVRVFFNSPEDSNGSPKYGNMTIDNQTFDVMVTTSGDILVNALNNGIDIDRHLVPIPVESSGVDGIAFALPEKSSQWKMKFEGIPVEVETEALYEGEVPRRAIVIRLKNELPELLGFEHLADEIMDAGEREGVEPVFTPMILSHYIEKLELNLADLGVASIDDLYLNYVTIVKVRKSENNSVHYEVDEEKFHPESITMREAIDRGWASYDSASNTVTLNVAAIRSNTRGESGELALSLMKNLTSPELNIVDTIEVNATGGNVTEITSEEAIITYVREVGDKIPAGSEVLKIAVVTPDDTADEIKLTFDNLTGFDLNRLTVVVNKGSVEVNRIEAEKKIEAIISQFRSRGDNDIVGVLIKTPEEAVQPTAGGGGGGCSVTPATPASGLFNFGVLLSGLLGLFGFRRKKH